MASIYKRGKIYWIEYRENGIRKQISTKQTNRQVATIINKYYESLEKSFDNIRLSPISFKQYSEEYLGYRQPLVAKKTLQKDKIAIQSLELFVTEQTQMREIDQKTIQRWYVQKIKQTSATTANSLLRHLKKFFNAAIKSSYLSQNPCQIEKVRENEAIIRTLEQTEIKQLLAYLKDHQEFYNLAIIALNTGMRISEICRLKVSDISIERSVITIRSEHDRPTKSKKSRIVPIPNHSVNFFKELIKDKRQHDQIFTNSSDWLSKKFSRLSRKAGINCGLHDLRRTYGAWLVMSGCDLVTVQQNMGHSNIQVTVKHYAHLLTEVRLTQTNKLPNFIASECR